MFFFEMDIAEQEVGEECAERLSGLAGRYGDSGLTFEVVLELPFDKAGDDDLIFNNQDPYHVCVFRPGS